MKAIKNFYIIVSLLLLMVLRLFSLEIGLDQLQLQAYLSLGLTQYRKLFNQISF